MAFTLESTSRQRAKLYMTLGNENLISVPQGCLIQLLTSIRNVCDHAKGKEPLETEIEDLPFY